MSTALDAAFKSSEATVAAVKRVLNKNKTADDERSTAVVGLIDQALEHHAAIVLLMRSQLVGSAFALTRAVVEILVNGVWLTGCATDAEVMKFVKKDKIAPTFGDRAAAIDQTLGLKYFAEFKRRSWKTLNSYAHTGMLQIGRRFTGDKLVPSYTDKEKSEVLRAITDSVLLLVRPFLARQGHLVNHKEGHLDSAKEIDQLMLKQRKQ